MPNLTSMTTGLKFRGEQYKARAYMWNGSNRPRTYDAFAWALMGIEQYNVLPTVTAAAGGTLTGTYYYYIVPVNKNKLTLFGKYVMGNPSIGSAAVSPVAQKVTVGNIPATHFDPQVTHWFIYRNRSGYPKQFFLIGEVAIGTTTFDDDGRKADSSLPDLDQLSFNRNIPATFKMGCIFGERAYGAGMEKITTGTATVATKTVTFVQRTADVCQITTSAAHGYSVGQWVCVAATVGGILDTRFAGAAYILSTPSGTTFTYVPVGTIAGQADIGATAAAGTTEVVDFSGVNLPDGVKGAWFLPSAQQSPYRIMGMNSLSGAYPNGRTTTQLCLDRSVGALSASAYTIYRDGYQVYISEFGDFESWGPDGEGLRWVREVPGREDVTAIIPFNGRVLVFTQNNIFAIEGKGADIKAIRILPEPVYRGVGCVGSDAVCLVDDDLYWMTRRGPYALTQQGPVPVGNKLRTDWLDALTDTEQGRIVATSDGNEIWFDYPNAGGTECANTFRMDRRNNAGWWPERGRFATCGFWDRGRAYIGQGQFIIQGNYGTYDQTSQGYTGLVTSATTTTATDSGAAFPTASGGLIECTVHFFDANNVYQGYRRIVSNTGTQVTWSSSGAGGGNLSVQVGWRYVIGQVVWQYQTPTQEQPGHAERAISGDVTFDAVDSAQQLIKRDVVNGVTAAAADPVTGGEIAKKWDVNKRARDYAMILYSRTGAKIRQVIVHNDVKGGPK